MLYPCCSSPILCINGVYLFKLKTAYCTWKGGQVPSIDTDFYNPQNLDRTGIGTKITAVFYSQVVWFAFALHWRQQHGPVTETAVAGEVMECSCNKAPSVATQGLLQMWILILISNSGHHLEWTDRILQFFSHALRELWLLWQYISFSTVFLRLE